MLVCVLGRNRAGCGSECRFRMCINKVVVARSHPSPTTVVFTSAQMNSLVWFRIIRWTSMFKPFYHTDDVFQPNPQQSASLWMCDVYM